MIPVSSAQKNPAVIDKNAVNTLANLFQMKKDLLAKYRQQKSNVRELQTVLANTKAIMEDNFPGKSSKSVSR
jgi:hypothetical protein